VLLTKADKLSRKEAQASLAATSDALAAYSSDEADIGITLFSALKKTGLDDVAVTLRSWVAA
jgi:GTP-binding protein